MRPRPLLSVLIATMSSRQQKFLELLSVLLPQAEQSRYTEVIALHANGEYRLPLVRQALLKAARGDYIAYVDDDDMISGDYVRSIGHALRTEPDSVGFDVQLTNGRISKCSRHLFAEARASGWDAPLLGMADIADDPSPLWLHPWGIFTPTRREIALQCSFATYGPQVGEDGHFRDQLLPLLGREEYIPRVMYEYRWSADDSVQTTLRYSHEPRMEIRSPVFTYHPWSVP